MRRHSSTGAGAVEEVGSAPRGANRGDWACIYVYDTLAGSEKSAMQMQNASRQDELGIVGIFLWYRIGSAPCPSLPSIIDWRPR